MWQKRISIIFFFLYVGLSIALFFASMRDYSRPHVILISIDGARADSLRDLHLPVLHAVAQRGSYTYSAQTIMPSYTLPAHTSMFTGYVPKKHGVRHNEWRAQTYLEKSTIFDRLREEGKTVKWMAAKNKFYFFLKPDSLFEGEVVDGGSQSMLKRAIETISMRDYDFLFIHFKGPDQAGHDFGHDTVFYKKALQDVDAYIGTLLERLAQTGEYDRTTIIITADHGMKGRIHGGKSHQEMTIPWMIVGPHIAQGEIKTPVKITDTAAVILTLFGLSLPSDMDGAMIPGIVR